MKTLLLGHRGYLGSYLYQHIDADILEGRFVYNNGEHYDYVINCIGKPDLEYCEKNVAETDYSNWLVIRDIIDCYPDTKIINFSSYYVYDGKNPNDELSTTTDLYAYTRQKLRGERLIKNGVTFRLGKLFGHEYHQKGKLIEHIINNDNLHLDTVLFNPTSLKQILRVVEHEMKYKVFDGIYNLANTGYSSSYEYGVKVCDILQLKKNIIKEAKINRVFHNYGRFLMDVSKLNAIHPLVNWEIDFYEYLRQFI
jgi:dTDP-4-dehydrorhamnose reductase